MQVQFYCYNELVTKNVIKESTQMFILENGDFVWKENVVNIIIN
jgi:hypothetical protein